MNLIGIHSICICLFFLIRSFNAQATSFSTIPYQTPSNCNASGEYFDISHLVCQSCPTTNSKPIDLYNCRCNEGYYFLMNSGGGSVECAKCPTGFIQSLDGYNCVFCDASCQNCAANGGYRKDLDENGNYFTNGLVLISKCIICNKASSDLNNNQCRSCKPRSFAQLASTNLTSLSCEAAAISTGGMLIMDKLTDTENDPNGYLVKFGTDSSLTSWYLQKYLLSVYLTCQPPCLRNVPCRRNVTACQTLGNLCVLNLYNDVGRNGKEACSSFLALLDTNNEDVWGEKLPWLYYTESLSIYKSTYLSSSAILKSGLINLNFPNKCEPQSFSFYSAEYALNGVLKRFGTLDMDQIQLCNILKSSLYSNPKINPFTAADYSQECDITVEELLRYGADPVFFDIYLKYSATSDLLPVPVKTLNYVDPIFNTDVNRQSNENSNKLQRRIFLVDAVSAKTSEKDVPKYVRYAKSITIEFELVPDQTDGNIFPPIIVIDYGYVETRDLKATAKIKFDIKYTMKIQAQIEGIWITVGVLGVFSFLWAFIRIWIWSRRSGKIAVDIITLFKFGMNFLGNLSHIFFGVAVGVSIYWLIFFKGQGLAYVLIPNYQGEENFRICLIIAFVLKTIDIIHLIAVQCSYDIFFIDWERPKDNNMQMNIGQESAVKVSRSNEKVREETKPILDETRVQNRVSCWRSLFVANEWNEIQTFRKINPVIQLISVLFFLKVVNLEELTTADCNTSIFRDQNLYKAPFSGLLRVGMASSLYIGLGILQYLVYNFIYIRCIADVMGQFIDFCSVSNISMFIMTHSQYGYYIHGRSPHGCADTGMQQMAQALLKEKNDLSAKRGLEEGSDHQTFSISISSRLSKQYSKVMAPLYDRKKVNNVTFSQTEFDKRVVAYTQLNRFLIAFIDNHLREMRYIISKRNFFENVMDLELKEPLVNGYFYEDQDKSFEKAIFCGKERSLFIFDLVLFLFVDYFSQNYVLAALITYFVVKVYEIIRSDVGKMNISRKTLVDKRFLI